MAASIITLASFTFLLNVNPTMAAPTPFLFGPPEKGYVASLNETASDFERQKAAMKDQALLDKEMAKQQASAKTAALFSNGAAGILSALLPQLTKDTTAALGIQKPPCNPMTSPYGCPPPGMGGMGTGMGMPMGGGMGYDSYNTGYGTGFDSYGAPPPLAVYKRGVVENAQLSNVEEKRDKGDDDVDNVHDDEHDLD